jgi:phosphoglycolate phosphatase
MFLLPQKVRLVMFDLFDTLVEMEIDYEKIREEVKSLFVRSDSSFASWSFRPIFPSIEKAAAMSSLDKGVALRLINERENLGCETAQPKPGARETIEYLKLKGIYFGVFSRMNSEGTKKSLEKAGLSGFSIVLGREDAPAFKPDPAQVNLALASLSVNSKETIVVGDHPYDIIAGKGAGAFTVGVLTGEPSYQDLKEAGADLVVKDLYEFLGRLKDAYN